MIGRCTYVYIYVYIKKVHTYICIHVCLDVVKSGNDR